MIDGKNSIKISVSGRVGFYPVPDLTFEKKNRIIVLGDPQVTANNHATFVIQIQIRLRDYLRLLMVRTLFQVNL